MDCGVVNVVWVRANCSFLLFFRSLRKTTAEIQNYTFEAGTDKPPDKDNTTSKDSGISQLSGTEALEEALEELSIQSSSSVSLLCFV